MNIIGRNVAWPSRPWFLCVDIKKENIEDLEPLDVFRRGENSFNTIIGSEWF